MYSRIEDALKFMIKANKGLKTKPDNIDRSFHNMCVYLEINKITNIEDILVAAILHDIIDYTDYGYEEIEELFGTLVADIVLELSEDMSIAKWFDRKKEFVRRMQKVRDVDVINIMLADKYYELLSYYEEYQKHGKKMWKSSSGNIDENCFFYREIYNIGKNNNANNNLLNKYKELVILYFDSVDEN